MIAPAKLKSVPIYRQCPICFHGRGGRGKCYSTAGSTRYYKCVYDHDLGDKGGCGHTWTAIVTFVRVEHRPVNLSER